VNAFDAGEGQPIVVIPGIEGRWRWMLPALRALSRRRRTISASLRRAKTMDELAAQVDVLLDDRGIAKAGICGVSFGGLVALRYAASRRERTAALVIVSTPSPSWKPSPQQARYLARPWLSLPAFCATAPGRLWPEVTTAIDARGAQLTFAVSHFSRIAASPANPSDMAGRIALLARHDIRADCASVTAPTLVVTGEESLDRVVPVSSTREYTRLIAGARYEVMSGTGHIGLVTQPERFARIVGDFIDASCS
jgi:3-oxoadipate enol-lactonase